MSLIIEAATDAAAAAREAAVTSVGNVQMLLADGTHNRAVTKAFYVLSLAS
jgi:hypothetical protein